MMRRFLFYTWCIGGLTLYGFAMRWIVRSIAEIYGLGVMAISVAGFVGACWMIARRMDAANAIAAAERGHSTGYRPAPAQARAGIGYLPPAVG